MEKKNVCINSHGHLALQGEVTNLPCSFRRVKRNGRMALLARAFVQVDTASDEFLSALRLHVKELNVRLPVLTVTVSSLRGNGCCFVLQGLDSSDITSDNMGSFLTLLSKDFRTFVAYLRLHDVVCTPS